MAQVSKYPAEIINVGVDFAARIPSGLTITGQTTSLLSGDVALGAPSTNGTIVSVRVTAGTANVTSSIEFKATLSDGQVLAGIVDVPVSARVF